MVLHRSHSLDLGCAVLLLFCGLWFANIFLSANLDTLPVAV
jgi:hypothetical protein